MDINYSGGMWEEGVGRMEWSVGGKWDNCNSIINKYILKKKKNHHASNTVLCVLHKPSHLFHIKTKTKTKQTRARQSYYPHHTNRHIEA